MLIVDEDIKRNKHKKGRVKKNIPDKTWTEVKISKAELKLAAVKLAVVFL